MNEKDINRFASSAEEMSRAAHESYKAAMDQAFDVQKSNMQLSRSFFEKWVETLEGHAELNRRTAEGLAELVREQREIFQQLSLESGDAYDAFVESLSAYQEELGSDEGATDVEEASDPREQASEVSVWQGTGQGARESYLSLLERTGEMKRGSRSLPADFWDLPRPEDPDASMRRAVQEDRR